MANWVTLKSAIADTIKANGSQAITGQILQNALNSIISAVGENATFAGKAVPTTNPGSPDGAIFYFANSPGVYSNFDGIELQNPGLCVLYNIGGTWQSLKVYECLQSLGSSDKFPISQSGITRNIAFDASFAVPLSPAYISSSDGTNSLRDTNWIASGFLTEPVYACLQGDPQKRVATVAYYDEAKQFIKAITDDVAGEISLIEGASYFRVCSANTNFIPVIKQQKQGLLITAEETALAIKNSNALKSAKVILGKYWTLEGTKDYNSYYCTRIDLKKISDFPLRVISYAGSGASYREFVDFTFYVDENNKLHEIPTLSNPSIHGKVASEFIVPEGAVALLLSWDTNIFGKEGYISINGSPYTIEPVERYVASMIEGCKINEAGEIVEDVNYITSEPIPFSNDKIYNVSLFAESDVISIGYYNEKGCVRNIKGTYSGKAPVGFSDITYIRFCTKYKGTEGDFPLIELSYISSLANEKDFLKLKEDYYANSVDIIEQCTLDGWLHLDGKSVTVDEGGWKHSPFIRFDSGIHQYEYNIYGYEKVGTITTFSATQELIRVISASKYSIPVAGFLKQQPGEEYFRVCISRSNKNRCTGVVSPSAQIARLDSLIGNNDILGMLTFPGFIGQDGNIASSTDTNWAYSGYIPLDFIKSIDYVLTGHSLIGSICFYDQDRSFISFVGIDGQGATASYVISGTIDKSDFPKNAAYMRVTKIVSPKNSAQRLIIDGIADIVKMDEKYSSAFAAMGGTPSLILPRAVYTVCNDVVPESKGRNRNYSQGLYLDHCLTGITEEPTFGFGDTKKDRLLFASDISVIDSNEFSPGVEYNNGQNKLEKQKAFTIKRNGIVIKKGTVLHRSVLNSSTLAKHPKVLCIGDSITYAEQALVPDDGYTQNHAYHLLCKELFMKDKIDNQSVGSDITFLGIYEKRKKMVYKGQEYQVITHHEGIRGISMKQHINGQVNQFRDETTDKWSLQAWLNKYRTLDDEGNRLTLGDGTGSLINAGNLNAIDVCTPTHVIIALGMNGGGTTAQWQEMIQSIKSVDSSIKIGIAVLDSEGTYFPSLHPNCGDKCTYWNQGSANLHPQQYALQKMLQEHFGIPEYEADGIFMLPFYFITPGAESVALRNVDLPDSEFGATQKNSRVYDGYGWGYAVHTNGIGHANWAYSLYSWIKYTLIE